jgi:hypothetical protein
MSPSSDNETWIIEAGDEVISKKASVGIARLSRKERLVYCLWAADYGMRNAGDLDTARDLYPNFQHDAAALARELSLPFIHESFSLSAAALQQQYFQRFDRISLELQDA